MLSEVKIEILWWSTAAAAPESTEMNIYVRICTACRKNESKFLFLGKNMFATLFYCSIFGVQCKSSFWIVFSVNRSKCSLSKSRINVAFFFVGNNSTNENAIKSCKMDVLMSFPIHGHIRWPVHRRQPKAKPSQAK